MSSGYRNIPGSKHHKAVKNMLYKLKHPYVKPWVWDIIIWRRNDSFYKKDFKAYMQEVQSPSSLIKFSKKEKWTNPDQRAFAAHDFRRNMKKPDWIKELIEKCAM